MDLKMEVYSPALDLLGILEAYTSLLVSDQAFRAGDFTLDAPLTAESRDLLVPDNIIWFYGDTAGIVEYRQMVVQEDGNITLSVKGSLLSGLLRRRVLWGLYNFCDSPSAILRMCVTQSAISPTRGDNLAARKIPNLTLADSAEVTDTREIRKQSTGAGLYDIISDVAKATNTAFGVRFDPANLKMVFWTRVGVDRTIQQSGVDPVLYSTELDDVLTSDYAYNASEYKNLALVAGEGDGAARVYTAVSVADTAAGFARRELFVDARDLQKNTDAEHPLTDEEYTETLQTRGRERLAQYLLVESFGATVRTVNPTYEYGRDFFLGDTITVTDDRLGLSVNAVVEGTERSFGASGEDFTMTLGYSQPTIFEKLRKAGT